MPIYLPETNEIYFAKTKEYFNEVMSSYSNGNYRSAVVMLYSTVICDILLKLKELRDMYNDSVADNILKEIKNTQKESTSKSSWEKELLEKVRDKTNLIDSKIYSDLSHLFDDRCFSAHPAVNEDFELYTPNQETVIAHIKNALNGILIKPPIFIKSVINMLTEDLKDKCEIYVENREGLAVYLNNKYFQRMNISMKLKMFKTLWRFCFKSIEDENCKKYRRINRIALNVLAEPIEKDIIKEITENENIYTVANENNCLFQLVAFLSSAPMIYRVLGADCKLAVDKFIEGNGDAKWGTWFKFTQIKEHLTYLKSNKDNLVFKSNHSKYVYSYYYKHGYKDDILAFYIYLFSESWNYDTADLRYNVLIQPFLNEFSREQVIEIIKVSDANRQIYARGYSCYTNTQIVKAAKKLLGKDFDFNMYPNFRFDEKALTEEATDNGD